MIVQTLAAGARFGRLTVTKDGTRHVSVRCDCGVEKVLRAKDLRSGRVVSCGCFQRESTAVRSRTHGLYGTPTYTSYRMMIRRCTDVREMNYRLYGGRGIKVCDRWLASLADFAADMGLRPEGTTLDRIDPDGNYEPGNCRWATPMEQTANRRVKATRTCARCHRVGTERFVPEGDRWVCAGVRNCAKRAHSLKAVR